MLSPDASRFLAQSQSRLSFGGQNETPGHNPSADRQTFFGSRASARGYIQRQSQRNPYAAGAASQASRFPFAARGSTVSQAPLFYSATDEFREDDDGQEEQEREAADFYALQQSRRDFGAGALSEHSDGDRPQDSSSRTDSKPSAGPRGIRSSWTGDENDSQELAAAKSFAKSKAGSDLSAGAASQFGRPRDRLVDVELASTIHEADESSQSRLLSQQSLSADESPPSIQHIKPRPAEDTFGNPSMMSSEQAPFLGRAHTSSPDRESQGGVFAGTDPRDDVYDGFWATLFIIDVVAMLSTFVLVLLHTSAPGKPSRLGDTIYSTMTASFYLLGVDTVIAIVVALVWIAALRSFVRPLVYLMLAAVPIISITFSLYPFITSFGGKWHGDSVQDRVMRWGAFVPGIFAAVWVYTAYRGRQSLDRAISLLEFTTRIVAASPILILVGFATLITIVCWTWIWMLMFTRVFLGGHLGQNNRYFIIDTSTWWLGVYFFLTYLWTLGVLSGVQRATTAATTSQWYFYRNAIPTPSPQSVVTAAFTHSATKLFGTICLSTLLALLVRLPLLLLPARLSGYLSLCFYSIVPASIATLTNPLTLTYAAIHSQPLAQAARGLSELVFVAPTGTTATTALTPRAFSQPFHNNHGTPSLLAYRLAKMLLHATRLVTSLGFGFGGWITTARAASTEGSSMRGSLYAYVIGLIAGAIGWAVLGAVEGILSGVLDAVVICWGSEMQSHGHGQAKFCREAGELLADDGAVGL